jgi:hypothetical protein
MFNDEIKKLLVEVVTSWQVLVVTGVLIIYVFMVNSVARLHHRRRHPPMPKMKPGTTEESPEEEVNTDELGLEDTK